MEDLIPEFQDGDLASILGGHDSEPREAKICKSVLSCKVNLTLYFLTGSIEISDIFC